MGTGSGAGSEGYLAVRCYIDEILIPRLPPPGEIARADVHPRNQHQRAARVRPDAAVRLAENPALQRSAPRRWMCACCRSSSASRRRRASRCSRVSWWTSTSATRKASVSSSGPAAALGWRHCWSWGRAVPSGPTSCARRLRRTPATQPKPPRRPPWPPMARCSASPCSRNSQADWWRLFGCPRLDAVVAEAIAHNPTVEAAQASLRRSEDNLRAGYGVFFPQLDAQAGRIAAAVQPAAAGPEAAQHHLQPLHAVRQRQLHPRHLGRRAAAGGGPRRARSRRSATRCSAPT